ncbi:F-box only protein 36-like [Rhinatrema bivittatum]|uniref:F-box only protein 36-like n=1 Tax=Rhinatrema bivittatum TaxID=194408 RepID=UPI00112ADB36|nr:F-box only protein 36-like [Rhinatrema bivittatum]
MTSLLQDKLYEVQRQAPSPSKDLHHFTITRGEVIWRSWGVSVRAEHRSSLPRPREVKKTHSEFLMDEQLHKQVKRIFGNDVLQYTLNLCQGHCDFIVRMPDYLIVRILSFLDMDDIKQLSKTCRKFQKLCNSEEVWEKVRMQQTRHAVSVKQWTPSVPGRLRSFHQKREPPKWIQRRKSTMF